jgi:hypothetical protein
MHCRTGDRDRQGNPGFPPVLLARLVGCRRRMVPGMPGVQSQAHADPIPQPGAVLARLLTAERGILDLETRHLSLFCRNQRPIHPDRVTFMAKLLFTPTGCSLKCNRVRFKRQETQTLAFMLLCLSICQGSN